MKGCSTTLRSNYVKTSVLEQGSEGVSDSTASVRPQQAFCWQAALVLEHGGLVAATACLTPRRE